AMYTKHTYRFTALGEDDSVKSITRENIVEFYNSLCTPDNMVIAVYGDINSDEVTQKISSIFKKFKNEKKISVDIPQEPDLNTIKKVEKEKENITQAVVYMGFQGIDIKNTDGYALEIISGLYSDQGGRLFTKIREEQGLAYYVGAYSQAGLERGSYVFYVGTVPDKVDTSISIILKEIERLCNEPISQEELDRIKKNLIGENAIALQTNESQAFGDALNELYGLGYDNAYKFEERINKVTREDIQNVAKKYFTLDRYVLTILKPK
ncbi:MAG: insulinase family protein, partial [Candidatus Firestonebacteria bacterium]|nr:insulinase family protein [Candidatus Firestonebacteria bacterium]